MMTGGSVAGSTGTENQDAQSAESWVRFGMMTIGGFAGAVLLLSMVFSISGAVVASGTVTVEGSYQTVQHREGGIIAKILVRNGDRVTSGQVLIELGPTAQRAALAVTQSRISELTIQRARLRAERDGSKIMRLPASMKKVIGKPGLKASIASQHALFNARNTAYQGELQLLRQRIKQLQETRQSTRAQHTAALEEARLNRLNLSAVRSLYEKGYANRKQLVASEREAARLTGETGRLKGAIASNASAISEARLRLAQARKQHTEAAVDELRKLRTTLGELDETRKTQQGQLDRTRVRAPQAGFVHALAVHTMGGVVAPGAMLLQIIPDNRTLLVEARIRPGDIDKVHNGQKTTIRFPAFSANTTPALTGSVSSISAAEFDDPGNGSHFRIFIDLPADEIAKIGGGKRLLPGMPAEVFIETEARSMISYFLKPLADAMTHSLR